MFGLISLVGFGGYQNSITLTFASTLRFRHTCGQILFGLSFGFGWLVVLTLNWLVFVGFVKYHIQLLHWKFTALVGFG